MAGKHAVLSPSGAEKWVNCPGSARMEQVFKDEEQPSIYAAEGTAAHFLASEHMIGGDLPDSKVGETIIRAGTAHMVVSVADSVLKGGTRHICNLINGAVWAANDSELVWPAFDVQLQYSSHRRD